jgi:hypothetical protein
MKVVMNQCRLSVGVLFIAMIYLMSCGDKKNNDASKNLKILKEFEKEVQLSVDKRNAQGDSIATEILFDTLYVKDLDLRNYRLVFAQYHTVDNKLDLSILGIENFQTPNTPTFLLVDNRFKKYDIDSVKIVGDSLHVFCRAIVAADEQKLKIGFDLKFNGKSFPWSLN